MTRRNVTLILFFGMIATFACQKQSDRKIQLADVQTGQSGNSRTASSVLQVAPEEQTSIAILNFENKTGNSSLDWLERGLADMLVVKLSQSVYFDLVPVSRLREDLQQIGKSIDDLGVDPIAAQTASKYVENILSGSLSVDDEGLSLEAILRNMKTGQLIKRETVHGADLESILLMVDELSERLRSNLHGELVAAREQKLKLTDMTHSVEAFQCYSKALEYLDKFLYNEADSCLSKAIELDKTFAAAYLRLAGVKWHNGQMNLVSAYVAEARKFSDKLSLPDEITLRIYESELEGDIEKLVVALEDFMKFEPEDATARMQLANYLKRMGRFDEALEEYETVLEQEPELKNAYNQLGYLYSERGDFETGLAYIDKYQRLAPDEPNPYDSQGEILMRAGRFEEAVEQFQIALRKNAGFDNSARKLRELHGEMDNLQVALRYADQVIRESDSDLRQALAQVERAKLYWRFGKIPEAEEALKAAQAIFPSLVNSVLVGKEMFTSIGDLSSAQRIQEKYLSWFKKTKLNSDVDVELQNAILNFCIESDLPAQELLPIVEKITENETRPMQRQVFDIFLAILNLRAGNYEEAEKYCESQNDIFLELLTRIPPAARDKAWKFSVEAIQLERLKENPDYTYFDKLVAAGQQADRKDVEVMARLLRAQYHSKNGLHGDMAAEYSFVGAPIEEAWFVIGPFENGSGFHKQLPPEENLDLNARYKRGDQVLQWQGASDGIYDGYVDLKANFQPTSWGVGYAAILINSPDNRTVQLRMSTDEACKLWLNDRLVWQVYRQGTAPVDNDIISVVLHPGNNKVLLKITNSIKDWGFYFRVTDEKGNGFPDIKFVSIDKKIRA